METGFGNSLSILGTEWRKKLPVRACLVRHLHFPRTVHEFTHPGHHHTHAKQDSLFWPPVVQVQDTYPFHSTGLWVSFWVSFKFRALKDTPIRQCSSLQVQTALRQEPSPHPSVQPEGTLPWINEMKAWTGVAEPVSLLLQRSSWRFGVIWMVLFTCLFLV